MRVVLSGPAPEEALTALAGHEVIVREPGTAFNTYKPDAIIAILVPITAETIATIPTLRVVANVAVGYDNIDVAACTAAGVVVTNTPGVLDDTTADLAFALILMASRRLSEAEQALRAGKWTGFATDSFLGIDVYGKALGLVGYGRIAKAVARRADGFGMTVRHSTRNDTGDPGWTPELDELLEWADVISLHVPLTPATRGLIDARRIALLKPTAVLVNTARGPVVDEDALAKALESGAIWGAGLDVYSTEPQVPSRLLAAPHLTLLPHVGSATDATRTAMVRHAAMCAAAVLNGERPASPVNPEVLDRS